MLEENTIELDRACASFDQRSSSPIADSVLVFLFRLIDPFLHTRCLDWNNASRYQNEICRLLFHLQYCQFSQWKYHRRFRPGFHALSKCNTTELVSQSNLSGQTIIWRKHSFYCFQFGWQSFQYYEFHWLWWWRWWWWSKHTENHHDGTDFIARSCRSTESNDFHHGDLHDHRERFVHHDFRNDHDH